MKFGIREVCNVDFAKISGIGPTNFRIDTAKMTTLEGAASTVYAQGGWGNSRLMAWEGEKTVTFTIEDALISLDAFQALTGADKTEDANGRTVYTTKTTSFAGIYTVTAVTLFRDEMGNDHAATIYIPRAKLQSNLSLSMAPSGDPSTFTYTFDALASNGILFTLTIDDENYLDESNTIVVIDGTSYTTTSATPVLSVSSDGTISLTGATVTKKLDTGEELTNLIAVLGRGDSLDLKKGSSSAWYIV